MSTFACPSEQKVLSISIWMTLAISILGVGFGLISHSQSIVFDGIFSLIDAAMSMLVLFVSRLLLQSGSRRFQYGYWHFEPLVAVFNGSILLAICIYAFINGIKGVLAGGNAIEFGAATAYAVIVFLACVFMYFYERRANRRIHSEFIRIDMHSCLMSASITLALLLGFAIAEVLSLMGHEELKPYADPVILMLITCGLLPIPIGIVRRGLRDVFMVAPADAVATVTAVMKEMQQRYGFSDFKAYVAKSGRIHVVDITILAPENWSKSVAEMDAIRAEIAARLHDLATLDQWLSISFTTHREWL